tara:strand:- start:732 stop:932 length:201 start_codon:yes stop_codon:yes gene_type:complete
MKSRTPAIMMTDVYRVIVFTDSTLTEIFKISDFFVEDREGAYAYAKKWKFSSLVKIESTFNDSEEK